MKARVVLTAMLLLAMAGFAQVDNAQSCNQPIIDNANILDGNSKLNDAVKQLAATGADVHVVTLTGLGVMPNLDVFEAAIEKKCPEWLGTNGKRKSTLLLLMLDPKDHKSGIYYGSAWTKALDDHYTRIYNNYMRPRYASGEWTAGLIAGAEQITQRIKASQDEALHPAVSTTVNQATDYSGLWSFLGWLLVSLVAIFAFYFGWVILARRRREFNETAYAQQLALASRNRVTSALAQLKGAIMAATDPGSAKLGQAVYDVVSEQYGDFTSSRLGDPEQKGMPVETYKSMSDTFEGMAAKLYREIDRMNGVDDKYRDDGHNSFYPMGTRKHHRHDTEPVTAGEVAPQSTPTTTYGGSNTVVVVNNEEEHNNYPNWGSVDSSSDSVSGSGSIESPSRSDDDSDSSSSFGGGGSSSFDDSSSSSSSFDSGGSSDFSSSDSGSSFDSGGGGSSDF